MAQGMKMLGAALAALPEVRELLLSLDAGTSPIAVSGLSSVHRAQLSAAVDFKKVSNRHAFKVHFAPPLKICVLAKEPRRTAGLSKNVPIIYRKAR